MSDVVIKVENLSKQYRLGELGTGTLSHDLNRWWHKLRRKEDPYLKIGETNDRSTKGNSEYAWALRDINFEVKQGEVLGIIGKNGAGKSTLLKLLSRVTAPTTGTIKAKGRIASLLEVGTGFHEELTGRENIFLNGAILGMTKSEILSKFDEIVAFSGTERYIDTPVKRYSSGMRVRLAFAVAAHLDPEILIVDEVLAVGDVEFQKKAIGKMKDVSRTEGRTVLFVSHNMVSLKALCTKGIMLANGSVTLTGSVVDVVDHYFRKAEFSNEAFFYQNSDNSFSNKTIQPIYLGLFDDNSEALIQNVDRNQNVYIKLVVNLSEVVPQLSFGVSVYDQNGYKVLRALNTDAPYSINRPFLKAGLNELFLQLPVSMLNNGEYKVVFDASIHHSRWIFNPDSEQVYFDFSLNGLISESEFVGYVKGGLLISESYWMNSFLQEKA